ncbi:PREDICTED: putative methyltransferase NSUN3 [Pseudopodoces humilis]|uniref:putative methyltransferase NSUN3 n=1 Tax=Pseudopodoces humilis TaxID=181119 RepID=UPI0006B751CB|nr:PREDICTED: putative methyltransferase NSUN3 [Pseudopodoces humilis]
MSNRVGCPSLEEQFAGLEFCPDEGITREQPQIFVLLNWGTVVLLIPVPRVFYLKPCTLERERRAGPRRCRPARGARAMRGLALPLACRAGAALRPGRAAGPDLGRLEKKKGKLQKQICQVVLDHFEKQYTAELGEAWSTVRDVLTSPWCWQHAVLLNRFSQSPSLESSLAEQGYHAAFPAALPYLPAAFRCYTRTAPGRFPAQKHQPGRLKEYYLLNAASLLPVLALEVKDGEDVLDLCAAPGGKSVAILQCACPGHFYCNEYDDLRSRWLEQTIESFIPDPVINLITVSKLDGRQIGDLQPEFYDKVLVDAPCSNDRSWLFSADPQQAVLRLMQRKELSSLQFQLLRSAVKALRPGGSLVYSTCTLSKAENSDVISLILNSCRNVMPVDISGMARGVSQEFTFLVGMQQHELLVLPEKGRAWGPMYVAKLKKVSST